MVPSKVKGPGPEIMAMQGGKASEQLDLTVVLVTSPSWSNPALGPLPAVIDSLSLVAGLEACRVVIVQDGYVVSAKASTKRGRVTAEMAANYELYSQALLHRYMEPRFRVIRCSQHVGFAHAVKMGLEQVSTTFALVAQNDRVFVHEFRDLPRLLDTVATHKWIRYVGFPSSMNNKHANLLHCKYGLKDLAAPESRISLCPGGPVLMPLIFWYDSQHVCHVQRYLEIFHPPASMPAELKDAVGWDLVSTMRLRRGDFIEDRFGQAQKAMMTHAAIRAKPELVRSLFRWFGSYLLWDAQASANELIGVRLTHTYKAPLLQSVCEHGLSHLQKQLQVARPGSMLATFVVVSAPVNARPRWRLKIRRIHWLAPLGKGAAARKGEEHVRCKTRQTMEALRSMFGRRKRQRTRAMNGWSELLRF